MEISYTLLDSDLIETIATKAGYSSESINVIIDFVVEEEVDSFDHEFGQEPITSYYVDPSDLHISIEPLVAKNSSLEIKPSVPFEMKLLSHLELERLLTECQEYVNNYEFS